VSNHIFKHTFLANVAIIVSILIYLTTRSNDLLLYEWFNIDWPFAQVVDTQNAMVQWLVYSFPDGLWCYALTAYMAIIWWKSSKFLLNSMVSLPIVLALTHELSQFAGFVRGTFDWWDLVTYIFFWLLALINQNKKKVGFS
jgi:hypothetical protein